MTPRELLFKPGLHGMDYAVTGLHLPVTVHYRCGTENPYRSVCGHAHSSVTFGLLRRPNNAFGRVPLDSDMPTEGPTHRTLVELLFQGPLRNA